MIAPGRRFQQSLSSESRQGCWADNLWEDEIAREQYSSFGEGAVVNCPDVDHMEEEVQVSVQVEDEGTRETHGKEQGEEQRVKERITAQHG